jgi:hypothetical protein
MATIQAAINPVIQPSLSLGLVNMLTLQLQAIPTPPAVLTAASITSSDSLAPAHTPLINKPLPTKYDVPKYCHGSAEEALRKKHSKVKRAMQRPEVKKSAPHGFYAIKPAVLNHHVRPTTAITTKLNVQRLRCTMNGWMGVRDKGGHRRLFKLDDMVGEDSRFQLRLEQCVID